MARATRRRTSLRSDAQKELSAALINAAIEAMEVAYENATFTDRTFNLHDSYGCAVYHNGFLVKDSIHFLDSEQATVLKEWGKRDISGREEVATYLRNYKPQKNKGFSIVVIAAMPYAEVLEQGGMGTLELHHKYKVISGASGALSEIAKGFKGKYRSRTGLKYTITQIKDSYR